MNKTSKILIGVVILQAIAMIWLFYDRTQQITKVEVITKTLEVEKDQKESVQKDLQNMLEQYDQLKTNNTTINKQLEDEKQKIVVVMEELKKVKGSNVTRIKELEKEAETLREIMRSYIRQIDSLHTKNQSLTAENIKVKEDIKKEKDEKKEIITQRDSLTGTIKKAAVLKTYSISATALNDRDKTTNRAKKISKIQVCFTLGQNVIAQKGDKNIYLRIAGPDNMILMNKESAMFSYQGREIAYSSKRKVDYQGIDANVCIFWINEGEQAPGTYTVNIFVDGYDIGESNFILK